AAPPCHYDPAGGAAPHPRAGRGPRSRGHDLHRREVDQRAHRRVRRPLEDPRRHVVDRGRRRGRNQRRPARPLAGRRGHSHRGRVAMKRPRGFTLIELMVALVVSSLLVGMILAIFSRLSIAYRGQQQIAGVQQVLAAARATIELDAKQAGLALPQGFKFANTNTQTHAAVSVINNSNGPDQIYFYYADTTVQAAVQNAPSWPSTV